MAYTDREILKLLKEDREQGAAALLEVYTGLLWSVCARRLENPEDIRECVNESFAEFCMSSEKYDHGKGSLKNYLCLIADRNAVNRYRDNRRREKAQEAAAQDRADDPEKRAGISGQAQETFTDIEGGELTREELEAAIEALEPVESQIIRMKYYEGLSYQEIADRLNLNYETVKKRGQRSLRKLWKMLVIGLIIILLAAACAVIVRRYFQFAEGVGFNWSEEDSIYRMAETSGPCEADGIIFSMDDVVYRNGEIHFIVGYHSATENETEEERQQLEKTAAKYINNLCVKQFEMEHMESRYHYEALEMIYEWKPEAYPDEFTLEVELAALAGQKELEQEYGSLPSHISPVEGPDPTFTVKLAKVEMQEDLSAIGSVQRFEDTGFVVCSGVTEEDETSFSLYLMNEGMEGGTYKPPSFLTECPGGIGDRESEPITVTSEDGQVQESGWISYGYEGLDGYVIHFPKLEPGIYTMHIPYISLTSEMVSEAAYVRLPKEIGESISCDETLLFPNGSGVRLKGIKLDYFESGDEIVYEDGEDKMTIFALEPTYRYELEIERISLEKLEYCAAMYHTLYFFGDHPDRPAGEDLDMDPRELHETYGDLPMGGAHLANSEVFLYYDGEGLEAADWMELRLEEPGYLYDKSFDVKVVVE